MSLNLSVNQADRASLQLADFLFAAAVHLLVIILIMIVSWWQSLSTPEPLKRIEVQMISAKELKNMQIAEKMRSIQKKRAAQPKPKPAVKPKQKKSSAEDTFDPFAPMASESDVTTPKSSTNNDLADIMGKQLSQKELDRYIAMMQKAVQDHWKVPAGVDSSIPDPLVEMILNRNGTVASARIVESSGNSALDQTLITAIYAAAPFQVPDKQFEAFRTNQVRFRPLK